MVYVFFLEAVDLFSFAQIPWATKSSIHNIGLYGLIIGKCLVVEFAMEFLFDILTLHVF